jgi:hypothetical protein
MNMREQGLLFEHYYARYFFYYSNYFESLLQIQMDKNVTYQLRLYAQTFHVRYPTKGSTGQLYLMFDARYQSSSKTIICIILLLFQYYFINYTHYFKRRNYDSGQYSLHK